MKHTYSRAKTFHEVTTAVIKNELKKEEEPAQETELFYKKPNKFNYSTRTAHISGVAVSSGKEYYLYLSSSNECVKGDAPKSISGFYEKTGGKGLVNPSNVIFETFLLDGRLPPGGIESSRVESSSEKVGDVTCYLLSLEFPTGEKQKLWIGTKDFLIWKNQITITQKTLDLKIDKGIPQVSDKKEEIKKEPQVLLVMTETMKLTEVNRDIPEAKFSSTPPAGAKLVTSFSREATATPDESLSGSRAPEFTLQTIDGKKVALGDFKGRVVILDFWDSWFKPCADDLKTMQRLYEKYGSADLMVLGINEEEDEARKRAFINENGLTFPNLDDVSGEVSKVYRVNNVPRIIIVNQEGMISADFTGIQKEEVLKEELKKLNIH